MAKKTKGQEVIALLAAVTGQTVEDTNYVNKKVYSRAGKEEQAVGVVTGASACRLDGCGGTRLHVRWEDGKRTYPCAKGCKARPDGDLEIE